MDRSRRPSEASRWQWSWGSLDSRDWWPQGSDSGIASRDWWPQGSDSGIASREGWSLGSDSGIALRLRRHARAGQSNRPSHQIKMRCIGFGQP